VKPALKKGKLTVWKDERGFGFIRPAGGGKDIFLHISALRGAGRRPKVGDTILYERETAPDGRIRAVKASIQGVASRSQGVASRRPFTQSRRRRSRRVRKPVGSLETLIGLAFVIIAVIVMSEFGPSRSPSPIARVTRPACVIKGNISMNSGNKIYHTPGMEDYESTVINPEKGERWFCSESEAIAAGWTKAPR